MTYFFKVRTQNGAEVKKKFRDHLCRSKCPFFENVANVVFSETSPDNSEDEIGQTAPRQMSVEFFFGAKRFRTKESDLIDDRNSFFSDCSKLRRRLCLFRRKAVNCETGFTGWKTERN